MFQDWYKTRSSKPLHTADMGMLESRCEFALPGFCVKCEASHL